MSLTDLSPATVSVDRSGGRGPVRRQRLAPRIEARLPESPERTFAARAIAATGIVCLQTAMEELARRDGEAEIFALYDAAIATVTGRRPA